MHEILTLFFNEEVSLKCTRNLLLTLSLPTEEIFLMHSENRPVANLPAVDFRFQPREMPLVKQQDTQLPVFHFIYWFSSPYRKV